MTSLQSACLAIAGYLVIFNSIPGQLMNVSPAQESTKENEETGEKKTETEAEKQERLLKAYRKGMMDAVNERMQEDFGETVNNLKHFPVTLPLPEGAQLVGADLKIAKGTPLAACRAGRWESVTAIREYDDGSIFVHWNNRTENFDCSLVRKQLIIEDKTVDGIEGKAGEKAVEQPADSEKRMDASELRKTLRIWTDITGKHKVEAFYVSATDTEVKLQTAEGREIKLAIEKLCQSDRDLLSSVNSATSRPQDRWSIEYTTASRQEYFEQLDFFNIELGAADPHADLITYASDLSAKVPKKRTGTRNQEKRISFRYQKGFQLQLWDIEKMKAAGISTEGRFLLQFYPSQTIQMLLALEKEKIGSVDVAAIRKTAFGVRATDGGFEYYVKGDVLYK